MHWGVGLVMSWDLSAKCCHTALQSVQEQPVVTGKVAVTSAQEEQPNTLDGAIRAEEKADRERIEKGVFHFHRTLPTSLERVQARLHPIKL